MLCDASFGKKSGSIRRAFGCSANARFPRIARSASIASMHGREASRGNNDEHVSIAWFTIAEACSLADLASHDLINAFRTL